MANKEEKTLVIPSPTASMADKVEYAWKVVRKEIEAEAEKSGAKIGFSERMMMNAFEDMLPAIFTLAPDQAKKYGERIYGLMAYTLGYTDTPTGE